MIELLAMNRSASAKLYVDDVFSAYMRTGTGASATITTGNDISGKGGLVISKSRSAATDWKFTDTARGVQKALISNSTAAESTDTNGITAFGSTGHTVGSDTNYNNSGATYIDYEFCKAAKFFDVVTYTGNGDAYRDGITHSLGITPGMIIVKATSTTGDWIVWHRSSTGSGNDNLCLNQTLAAQSGQYSIQDVTSLKFAIANDATPNDWPANSNGVTYVAYLFAHDTSADGIIQCGSFTTDVSGNATVTLGWEPQFIITKIYSGATGNWIAHDTIRGADNTDGKRLYPNLSAAEDTAGAQYLTPTATGFTIKNFPGAAYSYIYLAIRRPNKPPTSGTQVFGSALSTATTGQQISTGFVVDTQWLKYRPSSGINTYSYDRLRGISTNTTEGGKALYINSTVAEASDAATLYWNNTGFQQASGLADANNYIYWNFRRAPGVFDVVCYTGTGSNKTESHNLGAVPELIITKVRSGGPPDFGWGVYASGLGATKALFLETTDAEQVLGAYWNDTAPTISVFTVGNANRTNRTSYTYVAYLFATKAGISKVGSYTGNGTNQTINCGFSGGARFILIKRTDSTGDWYVWDSVRGIVAGNDPHLSLNTTAAEVTTDDSIDPDSTGFIVNQDAATNINVNTATYIFLAFA